MKIDHSDANSTINRMFMFSGRFGTSLVTPLNKNDQIQLKTDSTGWNFVPYSFFTVEQFYE